MEEGLSNKSENALKPKDLQGFAPSKQSSTTIPAGEGKHGKHTAVEKLKLLQQHSDGTTNSHDLNLQLDNPDLNEEKVGEILENLKNTLI